MHFILNRDRCCWEAVSVNTGRLYVIDLHDNGFFQIGANVYRTFFDAIRCVELFDAEQAEQSARFLEAV